MLENKKDAADLVGVEINQAKLDIKDWKADLERNKTALDEHLESRRLVDVNPDKNKLIADYKDRLKKVQAQIVQCVQCSKELVDHANRRASELAKQKKGLKALPFMKASEQADRIRRVQAIIMFNRGMVCKIKNVQLLLVPFAAWISEGIRKIQAGAQTPEEAYYMTSDVHAVGQLALQD